MTLEKPLATASSESMWLAPPPRIQIPVDLLGFTLPSNAAHTFWAACEEVYRLRGRISKNLPPAIGTLFTHWNCCWLYKPDSYCPRTRDHSQYWCFKGDRSWSASEADFFEHWTQTDGSTAASSASYEVAIGAIRYVPKISEGMEWCFLSGHGYSYPHYSYVCP